MSADATESGTRAADLAASAQAQIVAQTENVTAQVESLQGQVAAASSLEPTMVALREEVERQRDVLASSEEFTRNIFKNHRNEYFRLKQSPETRYAVVPKKDGRGATVYVLLKDVPIAETLQLQYHIFAQPRNSFFNIHNLVVFNWADPVARLEAQQLAISYFPDKSARESIQSLTTRDGRVFADGEPMFRLGEPDPEFKGNKWILTTAKSQ